LDNVKPDGFNGKASVETLLKLASGFQTAGLYPVPKRAGDKIAHWKFWMKRDGHVPLEVNDENLREYLPHSDIDGLILAVGKSANSRLVVLDIDPAGDHASGRDTYVAIQALSPTNYVVATPSNGLHLYYILPDEVPTLKPTTKVHWQNLDIRAKNSLIGLPGSFQQYTDKAEKKGVAYGHVGYYRRLHDGDYSHIPVMGMALYQVLWQAQNPVHPTAPTEIGAHNYEKTPDALARLEAHMKRPLVEREKLVLELLSYILPKWENKTYDQWMQMWMAAWHGSDGSSVVRDYIGSNPVVWAGRKHSEVSSFNDSWDSHRPLTDGYTVASLMYLARQEGWLQTTGLEIPARAMTQIDVQYIQDWTASQEVLPDRVLVMSQTGSGKTFNIKYLYERLGEPKSVIFVPTTKLAIELAQTLKTEHHLPVTLYIDQTTGRTKDADTLTKAKILVTTLQTFGNKVHKTITMDKYGLVYFEESDQLFQQFARGGGSGSGFYTSHVKDIEARAGFAVIRDAFENSGNVWCVDATMTQVTQYVAEQMKGTHDITIIHNKRVAKKAPVHLLNEKGEAYQIVLSSLLAGKKVVVACDTAQAAEEVVSTMEVLGALKDKSSLLITSHTERNRDVHEFMANVNEGAKKYDLLAYNSVMASGVSITSVNPDVIVQIANYLTPRVNLQLLNRYRQQTEVYVFYQQAEALYDADVVSVLGEALRRAGIEASLINMPLAERTPDAQVRSHVAAMSVADESMQRRSVRDFYVSLLQRDGREVQDADPVSQSSLVNYALKSVRAVKKEMKEELKHTWPETRPINRDDPADPDMTDIEVAQGEIHATIEATLFGNIPTDTDPVEIYETVQSFRGASAALSAFVRQGDTLKTAESYLADEARAITTLANNITLIQVMTTVHYLFPSITDKLTDEQLDERAPAFMRMMASQKENYDAVINSPKQKWDVVYARTETDAERAVDFSKILLARVGLKQKSVRGTRDGTRVYLIENAKQAMQFLKWRYPNEDLNIEFADNPIRKLIEARGNHIKMFQAMSQSQQQKVMRILNDEKTTDFPTAVETVIMGEQF